MRPMCPLDFKHFASLMTEKTTRHQNVQRATLNGESSLKRLFRLI